MYKQFLLALIPLAALGGCGGGGGYGGGGGGGGLPPATTTTSLADGVVNQSYGATLAATGGRTPYTWSIATGALPPGLTLSPSTGQISGAPTAPAAAAPLTVKVTDSRAQSATANLTLTIAAATAQTIAAPAANVAALTVDSGPTDPITHVSVNAANSAYVSVTVCAPGTLTCQTVDHIEVDTASVGLRIISAALTVALPLALNTVNPGKPLAECLQFADGDSWGALRTADVRISGESAGSVTVHVIGDAATGGTTPPASANCTPAAPLKTENTVGTFGANGILGVGGFVNDCNSTGPCGAGNSATYYSCTSPGSCTATSASALQQVPNPATGFADNNGVIVELPPVPDAGAVNPTGVLVFGIGTQGNNALTGTKLTTNPSTGLIQAKFNGTTYTTGFLDSGSNANFISDGALTICASPNTSFYCPASLTSLSATLTGANSAMLAADFNVDNAATMFATANTAFPNLGGPNSDNTAFDLGLSFFYGRNVFTGFETIAAGVQTAPPYFAY
ncbi:MAG: hypothetical protein PVSMB6_08890 [Steroidobacteraceae bacterium]